MQIFQYTVQEKKADTSKKTDSRSTNGETRLGTYKIVKPKSTFYPFEAQGHFIQTFYDLVLNEYSKLSRRESKTNRQQSNLTKKEIAALQSLQNTNDIVICATDKGGGVVILNYEDYHEESLNILFDMNYYEIIMED